MKKILLLFTLMVSSSFIYAKGEIDMNKLQQFQKEFDEEYFEINEGFEKLRHILLHLVKSTGKMATYCEAKEHDRPDSDPSQVQEEVLADLLIHALQIANYFDIDLMKKYDERIQFIKNRAMRKK